ncbi:MAG: F0F1 ATP synthase subunit B [Thermodesulfovibrionales bacterium]
MGTRLIIATLTCILCLGIAAPVIGEDGGGHGSPAMDWVWKFLNFGILIVVLFVFLRKPLNAYFKSRTELIERSIKEATAAKAMAEQAVKEMEEKLRLKDEEIEKLVAAAARAGEADRQKLIEEGKKMSEKILEQARTNIESELKNARERLKADATELAVDLAEKKLKQSLSDKEQQRILEESLRKLEG